MGPAGGSVDATGLTGGLALQPSEGPDAECRRWCVHSGLQGSSCGVASGCAVAPCALQIAESLASPFPPATQSLRLSRQPVLSHAQPCGGPAGTVLLRFTDSHVRGRAGEVFITARDCRGRAILGTGAELSLNKTVALAGSPVVRASSSSATVLGPVPVRAHVGVHQ